MPGRFHFVKVMPETERVKKKRGWGLMFDYLKKLTIAAACAAMAACVTAPDEELSVQDVALTQVDVNGVSLRVAEAGPQDGPLVVFVHGWPELWYSWRYQIPALAEAGYHVIAPDMRGYGGSDAPEAVEAYDIHQLTADIAGLVDHYGYEDAAIVGHDWGAIVSWYSVLLHPEKFNSLVAMSVPYNPRGPVSPIEAMQRGYGDNFFYILYFQEPGAAEAEFDANPRGILQRLYASPDTPRMPPEITDPLRAAGGWIPRFGEPTELPDWLSEDDLQYYVDSFSESGFRGGINYYRNFHRNWETTEELDGAQIDIPVLFLAGTRDTVIRGATAEQLEAGLSRTAQDLRDVHLIDGIGHWVQQEAADEVNAQILDFLADTHD